jgi:prolyl-tRNA synthetase
MLQSKLFYKTKKQTPKDAEIISHKLLLKGDFIAQETAGVYSFLPLGWRVHRKIEQIIREEMDAIGGQEVFLSVLQPKALWQETGRWKDFTPPLFKLKDRHNKELALGPTHEEMITDLARKRIESYKDLPFYLYQIQNKFRNEMRSTGGLLRVREFIMKDLYSFHSNEKDLVKFYNKVKTAYLKIFKRCDLKAIPMEAESGSIGGSVSHEFAIIAKDGESKIFLCPECGWAISDEKIGRSKKCVRCKAVLEKKECIEASHGFNLGTKYSKVMGALFVGRDGKKKPVFMGCYGLGLGRLMAAIIEIHHDKDGIIWPKQVAPFDVHLIALENNKKVKAQAEKIYNHLQNKGIEVLYDDRDETPGIKFVEADLIGIPLRVVVSERSLKKQSLEIKKRTEKEGKLVKIKSYVHQITR